jgi:hypothetical protein
LVPGIAKRAIDGPRTEGEALDALRDLQAAVGVGVSYQDYGTYLIEAKQRVERAYRDTPPARSTTDAWSELNMALDDYEFANRIWHERFEGESLRDSVWEGTLEGDEIQQRYPDFQFERVRSRYATADHDLWFWSANIDSVVQRAWRSASHHVSSAEAAIKAGD